jgi:sugar/nucleoside kinase (ribokinase family)
MGDDSASVLMRRELAADLVDDALVVQAQGETSAFTYVVVDAGGATRTCIHTPMREELSIDESRRAAQAILSRSVAPDWVHFDSRHTEAAVALAETLSPLSIPMSIDIEKLRPHVDRLLPLCSVVFTNQHFPAAYYRHVKGQGHSSDGSHEETPSTEECMALLLETLSARVVVCTQGSSGSVLVKRRGDDLSDMR